MKYVIRAEASELNNYNLSLILVACSRYHEHMLFWNEQRDEQNYEHEETRPNYSIGQRCDRTTILNPVSVVQQHRIHSDHIHTSKRCIDGETTTNL